MKLMLKKAVCWTATIITLFAATLSPLVAFAATNVSDAKQAGQYGFIVARFFQVSIYIVHINLKLADVLLL